MSKLGWYLKDNWLKEFAQQKKNTGIPEESMLPIARKETSNLGTSETIKMGRSSLEFLIRWK